MPERYDPVEQDDPVERDELYDDVVGNDVPYYHPDRPYQRYGVASQDFLPDYIAQDALLPSYTYALNQEIPLSLGDRVRIEIVDGEGFRGDYEVSLDGTLQLPYIKPFQAVGHTITHIEEVIAHRLVKEKIFLPKFAQVSVRHIHWGPAHVFVKGAVFQPGRVLINQRSPEDRAQQLTQDGGDYAPQRVLTAALQAAGGVRPDAAIQRILLIRNAKRWLIDLSGIIDGSPLLDPPLAAGDEIIVESTGIFLADLVRPSQITPPGIKVFMSNLTIPADSNSQSAISHNTTQLPYGTRLLQGLVASNCVGGTDSINSSRYVVLASYNPLTGQSEVIERSVERLIRDARRDTFNPYLLPGDALACYDSHMTNIRDIARTVADILLPLSLWFRP